MEMASTLPPKVSVETKVEIIADFVWTQLAFETHNYWYFIVVISLPAQFMSQIWINFRIKKAFVSAVLQFI